MGLASGNRRGVGDAGCINKFEVNGLAKTVGDLYVWVSYACKELYRKTTMRTHLSVWHCGSQYSIVVSQKANKRCDGDLGKHIDMLVDKVLMKVNV